MYMGFALTPIMLLMLVLLLLLQVFWSILFCIPFEHSFVNQFNKADPLERTCTLGVKTCSLLRKIMIYDC